MFSLKGFSLIYIFPKGGLFMKFLLFLTFVFLSTSLQVIAKEVDDTQASREASLNLIELIKEAWFINPIDFDKMKELVRSVNLNFQDKDEQTALHHAAIYGRIKIVELLTNKGADPNIQNKEGRTALHHAAYWDNLKTVKSLTEKGGADLNIQDENGDTALHRAADRGRTDIVEYLKTVGGPEYQKIKNKIGETALDQAVRLGHTRVVKNLIEGDVDINAKDEHGRTILHRATINKAHDLVRFLVEEKGKWGVIKKTINAVDKFLIGGGEDADKKTINVNAQDNHGQTALHYASLAVGVGDKVNKKDLFIITKLVENGGDPNIQNKAGFTALDYVTEYGYSNIVKLLKEASSCAKAFIL